MTTPAGGELVGTAEVRVDADTTTAVRALDRLSRDTQGRLRDIRGRFVTEGSRINDSLTRSVGSGNRLTKALGSLRGASLLLSPALVPIAAQAAPIAASMGAATVAIGAFAAAAAGQATAISEAVDAEEKYKDAVDEHGAASKQAADAQVAYVRQIEKMPQATRTAAAALSSLKDQYQEWSDNLADDTMPVATKSLQTLSAVFPKMTPLVQGSARELDRFVTIIAGGVASPGFDRFMRSFSEFATGVLQRANESLIHFVRTVETGKVSGGIAQFMEYARQNGPLVSDTFAKIGDTLANLLQGAADVGPGLLAVVNALAGIVAAVPPGVITLLLQLALAVKAVRLAVAGAAGVTAFTTAIGAMHTAAAGATGVVPRLAAAFGTLSRSARLAVAGTGIGLLVIALSELSQIGDEVPPDVDKVTASLKRLAATGKVSGEAARLYGADLGELVAAFDHFTDNKVLQFLDDLGSGFGLFGESLNDIDAEKIRSFDQGLANLVKGGSADQAAAVLKRLTQEAKNNPEALAQIRGGLDEYKSALADMALEQKLAADAMGLFGQQAIATQQKLDAQKLSADGLRQSIQALNNVNQQGLGGMIAFEAAIDAAATAARENAGALSVTGGKLDLNSTKARNAATALSDLAAKTDEAAASARESGASWETVNGIYDRGRAKLLTSAQAMGLTRAEAKKLANQILKTPDKTARIKGNLDDLEAKLKTAKSKLGKVPDSNKAKIRAEISDLEKKIRSARAQLDAIDGKTANTYTRNTIETRYKTTYIPVGGILPRASGGLVRGFPHGGAVNGPGTATSDSIPALLSDGEFVMRAAAVRRYGVDFFDRLNSGRMARMATGGAVGFDVASHGVGRDMVQGLIDGLRSMAGSLVSTVRSLAEAAVGTTRKTLGISSPSRVFAQIGRDTGRGFIKGLTGTKRQIDQTAGRVARSITRAFRGTGSRLDNRLVAAIQRTNRRLQRLAEERDRIAKQIADARKFAAEATAQARGTGSLGTLVQKDFFAPRLIAGGMQKAINDIKAFTKTVRTLQKRGLNKELLRQILQMGPAAGLQFAKSLAGQNQSTIKQFNRLQRQLDAEAKKLGRFGADTLFDSGKKAGKGFLAGLKAQQKSIEQLMLRIAKGMRKAIRRALGIRSPSRVMAQVGQLSGLGLAGGLAGSVPVVDRAMSRLAGAVAGGVPTRLSALTAPTAAALPVGAMRTRQGAPATVIVNNYFTLDNHGVIGSPRELDDWLVRRLDRLRLQKRLPAGA